VPQPGSPAPRPESGLARAPQLHGGQRPWHQEAAPANAGDASLMMIGDDAPFSCQRIDVGRRHPTTVGKVASTAVPRPSVPSVHFFGTRQPQGGAQIVTFAALGLHNTAAQSRVPLPVSAAATPAAAAAALQAAGPARGPTQPSSEHLRRRVQALRCPTPSKSYTLHLASPSDAPCGQVRGCTPQGCPCSLCQQGQIGGRHARSGAVWGARCISRSTPVCIENS
jgi:hypothetical protein